MKHKIEETMDIYGMGVVFNYMLKQTGKILIRNPHGRKFAEEAKEVFFSMVHPNCFMRINLINLLEEYKVLFNFLYPAFEKNIKFDEKVDEIDTIDEINRKLEDAIKRLIDKAEQEETEPVITETSSKGIPETSIDKYEIFNRYDALISIIENIEGTNKRQRPVKPMTFRKLFSDNFDEDDIPRLNELIRLIDSDRYPIKHVHFEILIDFLHSLVEDEDEDEVVDFKEVRAIIPLLKEVKQKEKEIIDREIKLTYNLDTFDKLYVIFNKIENTKTRKRPTNFQDLATKYFTPTAIGSKQTNQKTRKNSTHYHSVRHVQQFDEYIDSLINRLIVIQSKDTISGQFKADIEILKTILAYISEGTADTNINMLYDKLDDIIDVTKRVIDIEIREVQTEKEKYKKMTLVSIADTNGKIMINDGRVGEVKTKIFNPTTENMNIVMVHVSPVGWESILTGEQLNHIIDDIQDKFIQNKRRGIIPIQNIANITNELKTKFKVEIREGTDYPIDKTYSVQFIQQGNSYFEKSFGDDSSSLEVKLLSHGEVISNQLIKNTGQILLTDIINFFDKKGVKYLVLFDFSSSGLVEQGVAIPSLSSIDVGSSRIGNHKKPMPYISYNASSVTP
jgi:uncharacterized protein YjgD (DUF1641 family)